MFSLDYRDEHHKGKSAVPETTGVEEGSAKRNIQRKVSSQRDSYSYPAKVLKIKHNGIMNRQCESDGPFPFVRS